MRKEELRKLRKLPATKEMMQKGKQYHEEERVEWWSGEKYKVTVPQYDILLRVQNLSGYIKVAVFLPQDMRKNIRTPRYEIFINPAGGEWITRVLDENGNEERWSDAMVRNLPDTDQDYSSYWFLKRIFLNRDGLKTLNTLPIDYRPAQEEKGIFRLQRWQEEQRKNAIKQKEKREQKPWDEDMALVPEVPPTFEEWMRKNAADQFFLIYEYDKKGAKTAFCSRCKREVPISGAKHNKETRCPACRAKAVFKASSRIKTLETGEYSAEIIQTIKGGIVVRRFVQSQWYRETNYRKPRMYTDETSRTMIFDDGTAKRYEWKSYKNKYMRWIPSIRVWFSWDRATLYKGNFAQIKKNPIIKQSAIFLWKPLPISNAKYLLLEREHPVIEMLAKLGMFRLADSLMKDRGTELDEEQTEVAKILKIDNNRLKRLREMNGNNYALEWMQMEKRANTIWPDEMIRELGEEKIIPSEIYFLPAPIPHRKCYNYLKKQMAIMNETMHQTLYTWRDYYNMAESLKMDMSKDQLARPKDLKQAHNEMIQLKKKDKMKQQAAGIEKKWPKVNEQLPKLKKFEFTDGDYTIVAPESVLDIVREGTVLRHCVHTCDYYFSRISTDESYLFFLRKSIHPDVPWYTMEVEPSGNIRQKRTTGDNQNADFEDAVKFLKKWQQFFKKQLTAEEKKLGEKANRMRIENYESLRKNGNKVWHGKIAGQLLADVLEKDFMEVV
jgi:DNA-directed RNA polymerase subunit RPC12/RpoP